MGGLLAADAARKLLTTLNQPPQVNIKAVLAFDSPFYGLHPNVLLHSGAQRLTSAMEGVTSMLSSVFPGNVSSGGSDEASSSSGGSATSFASSMFSSASKAAGGGGSSTGGGSGSNVGGSTASSLWSVALGAAGITPTHSYIPFHTHTHIRTVHTPLLLPT